MPETVQVFSTFAEWKEAGQAGPGKELSGRGRAEVQLVGYQQELPCGIGWSAPHIPGKPGPVSEAAGCWGSLSGGAVQHISRVRSCDPGLREAGGSVWKLPRQVKFGKLPFTVVVIITDYLIHCHNGPMGEV